MYWLLILNGHGSHLTPKLNDIYEKNKIRPICMPLHLLHLLQLLNISCFTVLKCSYSWMIEMQMWNGINHIDKLDFLEVYPFIQTEAFKLETVKNSFRAAGLVSFSLNWVILKLDIHLCTPTPSPSGGSKSSQNFTPKTPFTVKLLCWQASSIKALLCIRSWSSPSPSDYAIN